MKNLFFALQKDRQFKRQVSLLKCLSNAETVTTKDLAKKIGCSTPTLREDIAVLNKDLQDYLQIVTDHLGIISVTRTTDLSIDSIISMLAKQTAVYELFDSFLYNKQWSLLQATAQLAVSRTNLLRTISHMNKVLKSYNVSIGTVPTLTLEGAEADIRICLFTFFSDFGSYSIFTENISSEVETLTQIFYNPQLSPRLHFNHFRFTTWLYITKKRWFYKNFITMPQHIDEIIRHRECFQSFQLILQRDNEFWKLPVDEIIWLYISSLYTISYTSEFSATDYVYQRTECSQINAELDTLLENIFSQDIVKGDRLVRMKAFLTNLRLLSQITPSFEFVTPRLQTKIETDIALKDTLGKWHDLLEKLPVESSFSFTYPKDVAVSLALFNYTVLQKKKNLRVLFAFQGEPGFEEYLIEVSKTLLTEGIHGIYYFSLPVKKDVIAAENVQLVICNYDLELEKDTNCTIVRLSNIPTLPDWLLVRNTINQMAEIL